jgi:hypothetical protein
MTGEAKYFISVGGVERGPYTLAVLRDVAKKGLVTPDTVCRADGATTTITAGELLGLKPAPAPAPAAAAAAAAKQYAIKFQPHNPFRFTGKGSAQVRGRELVLDGKRARPFWFSKKTQVAVPLEGIRDSHT